MRYVGQAIRSMIDEYETDPNSIPRIRLLHSQTEKEVILLQEVGCVWKHIRRCPLPEVLCMRFNRAT